ncbi:MAG: DUF4339 domain-containing protein [Polyangiaceae bacterium]|nr:DUF4339 domain-containing protein [Polyangiaceae bacterium]
MKISCQSCAAKYTIADEKVVGKVIKIKCKKCSSTIVVNGNDPSVLAQLQQAQSQGADAGGADAGGGGGFDDQAATQLLQHSHAALGGEAPANPDEWTVSVSDDDQRTMTTAQVLTEYAKGTLTADTYLWKDGMADWLPIHQVEELAPLLAASSGQSDGYGAAAAVSAPISGGQNGSGPYSQPGYGQQQAFEATTPLAQPVTAAAAASPAAGAARRAGGRQSVDLFGASREDVARPAANTQMSAGAAGLGAQPLDKHTGERNETSVLFSLKDLAAAEAASAAKPATKNKYGASNDRVDDILSLGGVSAAPMLAPVPLNAPYIEPPPPPPPPSVAPVSAGAMAAPAAYAPPPKKSAAPYIVGGLGALALIGGIIFFVLAGSNKTDTANADKQDKTEKAETKSDKTAEPSKSSEQAKPAESAPTAETSSATAATSGSTSAEPVASAAGTTGTTGGKVALVDPKDSKKDDKKDTKKDEPKEEPKEEPKDTGKGGDAPFDRGAASSAMSAAAGRASGCKKADGPTGSTKVQVTFQPSGKGTAPSVGAPFAGTPTGSCIAGAFKGLSIPPFSGAAVPVSKTVNIR